MRRGFIIVSAASAASIALVALNAGLPRVRAGDAPPVAAPAVAAGDVETVEVRAVADAYAADAVIEAVRQATVSAQIAGNVTQLLVDAGDRVTRGQLLARIDTRETDAQVSAQRANVAQADAALVQAKLNYERTASLVKQNFVSQSALDKADADLKTAQAAVEAARAGATQAITTRSFAELRSPIDGVVTRRLIERGELAVPGKPVLEVHDPAALRAVGAVPQFVLPRVARADRATVVLPTMDKTFVSTRVTVLPAADARLLSTQVRADLPPALPAGVVPGTAAKILLPIGTARKLTMPAAAVIHRGEVTAATVVGADGKLQLRQIRIGDAVDGGRVEVLAGLAAGERLQLNPLRVSQ